MKILAPQIMVHFGEERRNAKDGTRGREGLDFPLSSLSTVFLVPANILLGTKDGTELGKLALSCPEFVSRLLPFASPHKNTKRDFI